MADGSKGPFAERLRQPWVLAAAAVHIFTALGIVCALMATRAILEGAFEQAFAWLGLAFVIDGIDGTFARAVDVTRRLPRFSGERLDLVIDYVTYVFVPVLALYQAGFLVGVPGLALGALILMSSLYHFSDNASKTVDHCFVGFPAIWNIVAFYLFAFAAPSWLAAALILACIALTFIPMRWLHPMRVVRLLPLNLAMTALWSAAAGWVIWHGFPAGFIPKVILGLVAAYGIALAFLWPWADTTGGGDT